MIRKVIKKWFTKEELDLETLKHWKSLSSDTKFEWLEDALEFGMVFQKSSIKAKKSKHGKN